MQYSELISKTWDDHLLFSVLVELTYRCNLDCFFCYNDLGALGRQMDLEDHLRFLDDLAAMNTMNLTLSGGEPLACPFFFALGRAAREAGFVVRIKSNGHALDERVAKRLKDEVDPFNLDVSLHGACAESHDRQTRVPGSFDRLMSNLETMRTIGLRVKLNAILTAWNENEFEKMYALADRMGLRLDIDSRVTPRDNGDSEPLQISPSPEGLRRLLHHGAGLVQDRSGAETASEENKPSPSKKAKSKHHCGAGAASVTVDPFGNVFPCVQWRRAIGNLHENSIREIWQSSTQLREIRQITQEVKTTIDGEGKAANRAGFCPALAEQLEGSARKIDRGTRYRIQVFEELDRDGVQRP